jgi:hypothetical protein
VLDWFRAKVHQAGGRSYQTLMNEALREHIDRQDLEQMLRRVLKEELRRPKARWRSDRRGGLDTGQHDC